MEIEQMNDGLVATEVCEYALPHMCVHIYLLCVVCVGQ